MEGGGALSWFTNLAETYDRCSNIVGISDEKGNILLPLDHMFMKTDICIILDDQGRFRHAEADKERIIIPCTEDSASRTNGIFPHPLHEQLGYLALNPEKHAAYVKLLGAWSEQHPKVAAVSNYIQGDTLINDLQQAGIVKLDERLFVRFSVELPSDLTPHLWEDKTVVQAWSKFCAGQLNQEKALCYVTGQNSTIMRKHPKGINPITNGAKLISCNDETNYTYKGRFTQSKQANAISMQVSQKAHAMLRYLIATQSYKCDTQAIVVWAIDDGAPAPSLFRDSLGLYAIEAGISGNDLIKMQGETDADYAKKLQSAFQGLGTAEDLRNTTRHIAILAEDAATTGRMSITFYQDLLENEYIERLCAWHNVCKWYFWRGNKEYISAPSSNRIIAAIYGEPHGESYNKIKKQARERLLHLIICEEKLSCSWLVAALQRVSSPFSYSSEDGKWDKSKWENAIAVTCALAKKYYSDRGEEFSLGLETERTDRDYLFGRLLAIADRVETHARYLQNGKSNSDKRPTNAVRYMQRFLVKPSSTWVLLYKQLNPYIKRLNGAEWYQRQIDEIMTLLDFEEGKDDKALSFPYLMGYSLQRRAFYENDKTKIDEEEMSNEYNEED